MKNKKLAVLSLILTLMFLQIIGTVAGTGHEACSNSNEPPERRKEREPQPHRPTPPKSTSTIIAAPPTPPKMIKLVCKEDKDCDSGFMCCAEECRDQLSGVCRDISGDGIPEWVPYSSYGVNSIIGSMFGNALRFFFWF